MIANHGRTFPSLLGLVGLLSIASDAHAQGNTFNPYGNSGYADYREFGNPMYSNNPALPGQSILNSEPLITRPRANSYQQYIDDLDGSDAGAPGRRSASGNVPYHQAYQRLNSQYNRVYQPNNTPEDRLFYQKMRERDENYAKALREPDPAKRAKLLRQVEQDSLYGTSRSASTKGATASKPNSGGSTTTARSAPPAQRRLSAPAPPSTDPARRPATNGPATRAPLPARTGTNNQPATRPEPSSRSLIPDPSTIAIPPPR
jgi:hypothetical protein